MAKRDYYEVLGVTKNASNDAIKKSYRRQAMKYHPDRNEGDSDAEGKFKEVKEAYDILSDSNKRAAYDRFGHEGVRGGPAGGGFNTEGFGDIFGDVFGDILQAAVVEARYFAVLIWAMNFGWILKKQSAEILSRSKYRPM